MIGAAFTVDGLEPDYVTFWKDAFSLTPFQRSVVDFYSAQSLAYIIGEIGLTMNQNGTGDIDAAEVARLRAEVSPLIG